MKQTILTGDRPSGRLHLGHYIGSLQNRVFLQENYDQYIMIADVQALTDNFAVPQQIEQNVFEIAKDYISIGIDAEQSTILIQSQIPEIAELTLYYLNLVNLGRLERNPTVKAEIKQKGYGDSIPAGFFCYPVSQAADITIFQAQLVPVGEDQIPMIEQTNEIVRKFNKIYKTNCLKECKQYLSHIPRLIGIDGNAKASKSLNNTIFLSDTAEVIKKKVNQMFTDPNHVRISDPGNVEGNVVFEYLDAFYHDKEELDSLKTHYRHGGLGDTTIKDILNNTLQKMLAPIRDKRSMLHDHDIQEILQQGTFKAQKKAKTVMALVKEAMKINYF